jgi:hypothetical protein
VRTILVCMSGSIRACLAGEHTQSGCAGQRKSTAVPAKSPFPYFG